MIKFIKFIIRLFFRLIFVVFLCMFFYALSVTVQQHGIMHIAWMLIELIGVFFIIALLILLGEWAFKG